MNVEPIHTEIVRAGYGDLFSFLDRSINNIQSKSILAITSKIISLFEGRVVDKRVDKKNLVQKEADLFLDPEENSYGIMMTIKENLLIPAAGIDESNADGMYILWPTNPQKIANDVRTYLVKRFSLTDVGVLITDSKTTPLRWGTTGVALSHSGFMGIHDLIGTPDIFGKNLEVTKVNVRDGLASSVVLAMGESREQTPLAIVTDVPFVTFQDRDPSKEELDALGISIEEDIYGAIIKRAPWKKGGGGKS